MVDAESRPTFTELYMEFSRMSKDPGRYLVIPVQLCLLFIPTPAWHFARNVLVGRSVKCSESCSEHVSFGFLHPTWKMSTWSPTFQQSVFKRYHSYKHFSEFLPTRRRQKSTGIDVERNYVTVSVCIFEHWKWSAQGTGTVPFIPTTRRTTLGDRAFPVTAARAWNALPSSVRSAPSSLQFRRDLKTALFQSSYPSP